MLKYDVKRKDCLKWQYNSDSYKDEIELLWSAIHGVANSTLRVTNIT